MTAYRPYFSYDPAGLTAKEIEHRWLTEHRFLPMGVKEPDAVADFIAALIEVQKALGVIGPPCSIHGRQMVLLGTMGRDWRRLTHRLEMIVQLTVGNRGIQVRNGIYRCPTPGCFVVASPDA